MAAAPLRQMCVRLGFDNAMALRITNNQGIINLEELENLDDKGVERLCQALKKPGGMIANPNAGAPGAPANIPNPGFDVPVVAEENLKLAAYYVRHLKRISRPVNIGAITVALVRRYRDLKLAEEEHKDPTVKPTINANNWPKTFEEIEEYLRNHLGHTKAPLAYVVRKDEAVPPAAADPAANYPVVQDEMIRRSPHVDALDEPTEAYKQDNRRVWTLLAELTSDHKCWTYMKPYSRTRDGRGAFLSLKGHYLGINSVNAMASKAETKIRDAVYTKETKRWNFESYVSTHKDQHQILQQLEEDHGYKGMDDGTKVRFLLAGIKTNSLDTIKAQILGDPTMQQDFDRCVDLFKSFLEQVATSERTNTFNVSRVGTAAAEGDKKGKGKGPFKSRKWVKKEGGKKGADGGGGGGGGGSGKRKANDDDDDDVKDRYYTTKEYAQLTPGQRAKLHKLREGRQTRQAASALTELQELRVQIAELRANNDDDGDDSGNDEPVAGNNRNNVALQRKKAKRS
jgi:hypothetical protein